MAAIRRMELTVGLVWTAVLAGGQVAGSPMAGAQEEGPHINGRPWRILLEQQLLQEKSCDLVEVLIFDEKKDGDKTMLEGKIRCLDGRQFDFARKSEHQKFELDLCQPAVC